MALSDTATAQLWETFRVGGGADLIREAVDLVPQELTGRCSTPSPRPETRRAPFIPIDE